MTARYANGRLQISLISDRMIFIVVSHSHFVSCHDGISCTHMHNFYHAMHARLYQFKSYLCSQLWFPTVQDVLHADWQDVWHSPQPPFLIVFCNLLVFNVFTCFMMLLSFFVISAHMGYAICPLPVILCIYSLSSGVLLTYTV